MNPNALHAQALAALPLFEGDALPADIQMFPPGDEVEFTLQDYPGETFKMKVDATVAAKAQADLERLMAAEQQGRGSAPFADKNHEDAEATFHPRKIYWAGEDPKAGGVRVAADWTPFGAQLVKAKAFKYFSGNFLFNRSTKKFLGLINENIGGLVNRPGFASQQAFAKADASTNNNQQDMITKEEVSQIITEALKPLGERIVTLEAKAKGAPGTEALDTNPIIVSLEARLKGLETNTNETVKASAKATVETIGVKAGRIAAQDKDTIAFWEGAIAANAKAADALAKMPVNPAFTAAITNGSNGGTATGTQGEHEFVQLVAAKAKAGKGKADAIAEAIAENQTAYTSWLKAGAGKL